MKKFLSLCAALSLANISLYALDTYDDVGYITFKYGLTTVEDGLSLDQHSFGIDFIGEVGHPIKPKLDLTYVNISEDTDSVDYLLQTAINAYYKSGYGYENIIPYFYGGIGYEYVGGSREGFDSNFYIQEGVGLEIPISQPADDFHVITELRLIQFIGSNDGQDSEVALFIGLRLPLGKTFSSQGYNPKVMHSNDSYAEFSDNSPYDSQPVYEESTPPKSEIISVNPNDTKYQNFIIDSDGDGVADSDDICPNSPPKLAVNSRGCPIKDDRRYIEKSKKVFKHRYEDDNYYEDTSYTDENLENVEYVKIEKPKVVKTSDHFRYLPKTRKILDIHFGLNSDNIAESSKGVIRRFVLAVNHTSSNITVEGYTDSTGVYEKNIELSKRRAEAVRRLMIQYGVDSSRIKSVGKGPMSPISTNDTEEGRAENRRIEIVVE